MNDYDYYVRTMPRLARECVHVDIHTQRRVQLRCAFTGRFMRAWVPVTHGPAWALDVDASLAPEVTS